MALAALIVVPIVAGIGGADVTLSSIYDDVASAVARAHAVRLITSEEMFAREAGASAAIVDCGADVACVAEQLKKLDAQLGLVVVINLQAKPALIALRLVDAARGELLGSEAGPLAANEANISAAIRTRTASLLASAGHPVAARVIVRAAPANASVAIVPANASSAAPANEPGLITDPPAADRDAGGVFRVAPGLYQVRVSAEGYRPRSVEIDAKSGEELELPITLEAEPAIAGWWWAIIGVAAAAAATTAIVIAADPSGRCVCFGAGDICANDC